ncbi:conserved hypothetical protein [Flavobacterium sp. 9AF]|uniref:hypothetical protein n=1 Tax=Flavobacterium sp. 9AF TaxID=2653142 RepID=UPI0012EFA616|nr:hypothetical protein [Flavobacterium sp. 9AF]VXB52440.1 conserved hypothetical protein [Flavobacterium sp. 9AF]
MKNFFRLVFIVIIYQSTSGQTNFPYDIILTPISISGLPGLHSYAFAQDNGKWLIIGGRKDGIHARQPFNAFPENQNNDLIYVVDIDTQQTWFVSLNSLSTGLKEQLQSTNMNFYQDEDILYVIGGYSYSTSANDHITHDKLTAIHVPNLINAIINNTPIATYFKQISNPSFAITGGQLGKIDNFFYLIGGHRFDGRYNPMNNPTFTQTYSNSIRKFEIDNSNSQLSIISYSEIIDAVHLHRRDYNLVPQVFPNGELGYTISSGVFQINVDLPFLYPIDVKSNGYFPQTYFNQYLSNYHSAKIGLYNSIDNVMHNLFFGGMSQYYYSNGQLIQDDTVPFVKTISRTTRTSDGALSEFQLPIEMPNLKGSGAEFIVNKNLPHYSNEVINLSNITANEFVIGHIFGGIQSTSTSAFTDNQTNLTSADPTVYEVKLILNQNLNSNAIDGTNPFSFSVFPNPAINDRVKINFTIPYVSDLEYIISSIDGKILSEGTIEDIKTGFNEMNFSLDEVNQETVVLTFIFDRKYFESKKIILK